MKKNLLSRKKLQKISFFSEAKMRKKINRVNLSKNLFLKELIMI